VQGGLETNITLELAPERGLPAVNFELLGIELRGRHRRIGRYRFVRGALMGSYLEPALAAVGAIGEPVDGQTQVREDLVIDDIVEEYGIRIEGVLRQDDAIVKCAVLADLCVPDFRETLL
jgi:hypothetical protein